MSTERSIHAIRDFVRIAVKLEYEPGKHIISIIIGGDHSISYVGVKTLKPKVFVNFDAHLDCEPDSIGTFILTQNLHLIFGG